MGYGAQPGEPGSVEYNWQLEKMELQAEIDRLSDDLSRTDTALQNVYVERDRLLEAIALTPNEYYVATLNERDRLLETVRLERETRQLLEAERNRLQRKQTQALADLEQAAEYFDAAFPGSGYGFVRNARQALEEKVVKDG